VAKPATVHLEMRLLRANGKPVESKFFLQWGEVGSPEETSTNGTLVAGRLAVDVNPAFRQGYLYLIEEIDEHYATKAWAIIPVRLEQVNADSIHRLDNLGFNGSAGAFDAMMRFQEENLLSPGPGAPSGQTDGPTTQRLNEVHDNMKSSFFPK
jgi:hypothetical protein